MCIEWVAQKDLFVCAQMMQMAGEQKSQLGAELAAATASMGDISEEEDDEFEDAYEDVLPIDGEDCQLVA